MNPLHPSSTSPAQACARSTLSFPCYCFSSLYCSYLYSSSQSSTTPYSPPQSAPTRRTPPTPIKKRQLPPKLQKDLRERLSMLAGRGDKVAKAFLVMSSGQGQRVDITVDLEGHDTTQPPLRRSYRTIQQKLDLFWWFISDVLHWTYGEMLYHTAHGSGPGMASNTQKDKLSRFFRGHDTHFGPSRIIELWFTHAYGSKLFAGAHNTYALSPQYSEIKGPMREVLTAFAAQIVVGKLERDAEAGIKPVNGLHVSVGRKLGSSRRIEWSNVGSATLPFVQARIQEHQHLLWEVISRVCQRKERMAKGELVTVRQTKYRPLETVVTNVISTMMFRRSNRANLLPVAAGILHFGCLAAFDLYRYHSRIGNMPAYNTVMQAMTRLAEDSAEAARAYGQDPQTINIIRLDNVHNYHLHRDLRIGRENKLLTGIFGALYEAEDYVNASVSAFGVKEKRRFIDEGVRTSITVDKLYNLIDFKHLTTVLALQWVQVLVDYIPELAFLAKDVRSLYTKHATKDQLPVRKTKVHPLACCSKNEMYFNELRDAYTELLAQIGQTREQHGTNLVVAGGDGLTVQKTHEMQQMLQFEKSEFDRLEMLLPQLEGWHQLYTSNNETAETHYGDPLTSDYSTLGHSATRLGRRRPADLKKLDYAQGSQLMYIVLDARMLDCWRLSFRTDDIFEFFKVCATGCGGLLPSAEGLFAQAKRLTRAYMSLREHDTVLHGDGIEQLDIPIGDAFDGVIEDDSSIDFARINRGKRAVHTGSQRTATRKATKSQKAKTKSDEHQYAGDLALANSRTFMLMAALSRECVLATAAGDPGRVYEITKFQLFQFAGSSCTNYTDYLLETIIALEYECSPEMKTALLRMSLVNTSGRTNHFCQGDLLQEYFNRLLDAVAQHKGVDYSDRFLREVWSRNVFNVAVLKTEWMEGAGLDQRSAKHSDPSTIAEIRTLLDLYRHHHLHIFRAGRTLDGATDRDRFNKGFENLMKTRLKKFVARTSHTRGLARRLSKATDVHNTGEGGQHAHVAQADDPDRGEIDEESESPRDGEEAPGDGDGDGEHDEGSAPGDRLGLAFAAIGPDGGLMLHRIDFEQEAAELLEELETARERGEMESAEEEEDVPGTDEALPSFDDTMLDSTDDETR
ncbi:hypothetical protein K525DRAFT_361253 [Schizophyllum commune Loenen D]|nr:hypothetical protein K525DRAFT_361253 [Schizophyllum commune Loenen D]